MRVVNMANSTVGDWKVISRVACASGRAKWECVCLGCGERAILAGTNLRRSGVVGGCRSCRKSTLASKYPNEYGSWSDMKSRVTNKNRREYPTYSLLGIDPAWKQSFETFFAHLGPKPTKQHTLDRIDNTKGYFPGNVRWATAKEQGRNTKRNLFVEVDGVRMVLLDAAEKLQIPYNTLRDWVHAGIFTKKIIARGIKL